MQLHGVDLDGVMGETQITASRAITSPLLTHSNNYKYI